MKQVHGHAGKRHMHLGLKHIVRQRSVEIAGLKFDILPSQQNYVAFYAVAHQHGISRCEQRFKLSEKRFARLPFRRKLDI